MRVKVEPANEELLCRKRREDKWLVSADVATSLEARIAASMPLVRHGGRDVSRVASLYLDTDDHALSARALSSPHDCLKARVRAYLPDDGSACELVFELKRHLEGTSRKWRLRVDPGALIALCERELSTVAPAPLVQLLGRRPLQPVVAVTYLRRVYQEGETLRVTFDRDVAWHTPAPEMGDAVTRLVASPAPHAEGGLDQVVVEVKQTRGARPRAVREALSNEVRQLTFSKFAAALQHVRAG